jgi:hypothetical protein
MKSMRCLFVPCVLAAGVVAASLIKPALAWAAPPVDEASQVAAAERACLDGDTQRGIELLTALYLISRHPTYLHNQARCYEQNGQYRAAAGRYREFLRKVRELPPERLATETTLTEARLAEIEAHTRELERRSEEARAGSPAASAPGAEPPATEGARPAPTLVATPPASGGNGLRLGGFVAAGAGALALAGGGVAAYVARRKSDDITQAASRRNQMYDPAQYQAGERATTLANIGLIAGPALLGAGVLLLWLGSPSSEATASEPAAPPPVGVAPLLAPGAAGGLLSVSY